MPPTIRDYEAGDHDAVVGLALRAWAPVFASMRSVLGPALDEILHGPDWREYQARSVAGALADEGMGVWVGDADGRLVGFVVASLDRDQGVGEVYMVAVDPDAQGLGLGSALTTRAVDWIREAGMRAVMIGTGGDPGHAAARRVYEKAGFTPFPLVQYYKAL